MLDTLLKGGMRLRSNTKRMMHTSLPSYQLPPSLIWQSHAEDQMCLRAALFSLPIMSAYFSASDTCTPSPLSLCFYTAPIFTSSTANCNPPNPPLPPSPPPHRTTVLLFEPVILLIQQITIHAWNNFCFRDVAVHLHHFIVHSQHSLLWRRKHILFMFIHPQHSGKGGHGLSACPAACYSTRT